MEKIYSNIKELRRLNGWTQDELAERVGYSHKGLISRVENGKIDLPLSQVVRFAKAFHVTPGMLLGSSQNSYPLTPDELLLVRAYAIADPGTRSAVMKLLDIETKKSRSSAS